MKPSDFLYVECDEGITHLADDSVLGGMEVLCLDWTVWPVTRVEPVADDQLCTLCVRALPAGAS